jgi:hypothetical protein
MVAHKGLLPMTVFSKSVLLFTLNMLDAVLTLIWIRWNIATEGNGLMARLLDYGEFPFLSVKLFIGAFAAFVLYRFSHIKIAQNGMKLALAIYLALMLIHLATGLSAFGWNLHETIMSFLNCLPTTLS